MIARTVLELIRHPNQWARLRGGADLEVAVEEFIRFVTPIHNMCRVATTDRAVGGETIRVFFEELVRRVADLRLARGTDVVEMPNAFVYGVRSANVEFEFDDRSRRSPRRAAAARTGAYRSSRRRWP